MVSAGDDLLRDAVARNAGAVVSLPSAGMFRHCKTRFLAPAAGGEADGFWIEAPAGEKPLIDALIGAGRPVGVAVKSGVNKLVFAAPIRRAEAAMRLNADTAVDALLLAWPTALRTVQRRTDYRAKVPDAAPLQVRVWRVPEHHYLTDKPPAAAEVRCAIRDLSVGGANLVIAPRGGDDDGPAVAVDQRLRVLLTWDGGEALVEGRARHTRVLAGGEHRMGVQFRKLDGSIEGRQALAALALIIGQLQRDEIRRLRLTRQRAATSTTTAAAAPPAGR